MTDQQAGDVSDGPQPKETQEAQDAHGPLAGVRILDLSSVVSGPMSAVILADQGADVIKIEPPGWGDGIRGLGASRNGLSAIFSLINRNKRSVGINLKHPEGQRLVKLLAGTADVVLQNYRPGKMARLGLGYEDLAALNSELIYASISGMGEVGPYAEQKVYDYVIQGMSGALDAQAENGEPKMVRTIVYDKVTALTTAQAITAALYAREKGAGGQHLKIAMLHAGIYFNWPDLMWNYSFKGEDVQYAGDLADMYEISHAKDGAIVSHHLGADTSQYSTSELLSILAENDIPVSRVNLRQEVADDPQVKALDLLEELDHPRGGRMQLPKAPVTFSKTPTQHRYHSPEVGQHTVEVLTELGLEMVDMRALAQEGAIG
ncbi:MAG: crotonobetainyl-CoA:carnitine CoA-transferase CaiB-like acyl-CoA transferase [Candidatus Azotimanducaceae bacterium]|jgi:crotonobetainyl-CoA:carnitine CoA-transferase CaiB-like acyl-CoA transferase